MIPEKRFRLSSMYHADPALWDLGDAELVLDWESDYVKLCALEVGESLVDASGDTWTRVA